MNRRILSSIIACAVMALACGVGLLGYYRATAQDSNPLVLQSVQSRNLLESGPVTASGSVTISRQRPAQSEADLRAARMFRDLVLAVRQAAPGQSAEEARDKLRSVLEHQIEQDLKQREQSLANIEARAQELREQLEERRQSKDETVKLLMMLVENPSAGLGLPDLWVQWLVQDSAGQAVLTPQRDPRLNNNFNRELSSEPNSREPGRREPRAMDRSLFGPRATQPSDFRPSSRSSANPFGPGSNDDPFGGDPNSEPSDPFGSDHNGGPGDPFDDDSFSKPGREPAGLFGGSEPNSDNDPFGQ